jgi:hypothetical protein
MSNQGAFSQGLDQDMDCDTVADLVELCVQKFADDPDQLNRFVGRIQNMLAGIEHVSSGDRRSRGYAARAADRRGDGRLAGDRRLAQDRSRQRAVAGVNAADFLRRFPDAAKISVRG